MTLPTLKAVRPRTEEQDWEHDFDGDPEGAWDDAEQDADYDLDERTLAPVPRRRTDTEARALARPSAPSVKELSQREKRERISSLRALDIILIPSRRISNGLVQRHVRRGVDAIAPHASFVQQHKITLALLALITVLSSTLALTGTLQQAGAWSSTEWSALTGAHIAPTPTPPPAPDTLDASHYVNKYGFDYPRNIQAIPSDEFQRMVFMLPAAYKATAAYDKRYHATIEPEMLVWWTHAEGIGARINYSNCANHSTRAGTNYFSNIENCSQANFWQLGYGNQFSVIYVLKNAFKDLYGDPNDTTLVQKVGQWVLDFDKQHGTVPTCGGYSCTFPAKTIDQISSGIDQTTGVVTEDNWWAAVLSRDPAINCYMVAHALTYFNHEATRGWVGCYYYEPCWGYESNRLGDVLLAWPDLRKAAHM
jgi:hypothetical protein